MIDRIEDIIWKEESSSQIVDEVGEYGAKELRIRAAQIRNRVAKEKLGLEKRVVLLAENGIDFIAGVFGILSCGCTVVPIDPVLPFEAVRSVIEMTKADVICISGKSAESHVSKLLDKKTLSIIPLNQINDDNLTTEIPLSEEEKSHPALILFSSGTTGHPKGIVLSHQAIINNMMAIKSYLKPASSDIFYIAKSMVHSSSLTGEILLALHCGAGIVALKPRVTPNQLFRRIEKYQPTILCMSPSLLHFFIKPNVPKDKLASLHTVHVSGSILSESKSQEFHKKFPTVRLINGYGLSEVGPRVSFSSSDIDFKPSCVGRVIPGVELQVFRDDFTPCSVDENGEIYVRSNAMMDGYLIDGKLMAPPLVDGWLPTRDLGYLDEDGDLFVVARKDDMIISSAHNVFPQEIENVVADLSGVDDCLVFGIQDEILDERIVCAIVPEKSGKMIESELISSVRKKCLESLAPYHIPKKIVVWEKMPLGHTGKKSRNSAKLMFQKETQDG